MRVIHAVRGVRVPIPPDPLADELRADGEKSAFMRDLPPMLRAIVESSAAADVAGKDRTPRIRCVNDGNEFATCEEAGAFYGRSADSVRRYMKDSKPYLDGLKFERIKTNANSGT